MSNELRGKIVRECIYQIFKDFPHEGAKSPNEIAARWAALHKNIAAALDEYINTLIKREEFAEGRDHLTVNKNFQSDKFPWCAVGFVPLKLSDPAARDLLEEYARRREVIDKEFPRDLLEALKNTPEKKNAGYKPFTRIDDAEGLRKDLKQEKLDRKNENEMLWSEINDLRSKRDMLEAQVAATQAEDGGENNE